MSNPMNILYVISCVSILSFLIIFFRAELIIEPEKIRDKGLNQVAKEDALGFSILSILFGILVVVNFNLFDRYLPSYSNTIFLLLGIGIAIILSFLAFTLRPKAGLKGGPEITILNFIWGIGYGWILPILINSDIDITDILRLR